jgi:phosphohistidine phosphatase
VRTGGTAWCPAYYIEEVPVFLYLVQHGEAKREEEDPRRPLTDKGFLDVEKVAAQLGRSNVKIETIFHSAKLRAVQTASVFSHHVTGSEDIAQTDGLSPLDDPWIWAERLKDLTHDTMLVGHLPHLAKLASLLLCGDMSKGIVSFRMGGVACLRRDDSGSWSLQWMLVPEVVA